MENYTTGNPNIEIVQKAHGIDTCCKAKAE